MIVNELSLRFFRNYTQQAISFYPGINILVGKNGQGKTNLIEALVYLSSGRSFRMNDESFLIQDQHDFTSIKGLFTVGKKQKEIDAVIRKEGKYLKVNQKVCKRVSEFVGQINVVLFSPDDMNYFDGSPSLRRKSLDLDLGKMNEKYLEKLGQYYNLLKQRNILLKQEVIDFSLLEVITDQMIGIEEYIIIERKKYIDQLNRFIKDKYRLLSNTETVIDVFYESPVGQIDSLITIGENLRERMKNSLKQDIRLKSTSVGIHRDDLQFFMDEREIVKIASQGQKRLTLLAAKLSMIDVIYENLSEYPILCLDDIFSELDQEKISLCLKYIDKQIQVIITATDTHDISFIGNSHVYYVNSGRVEMKEN